MRDQYINCYLITACLIVTLSANLGHTKNNEYPFSKTTDVSDNYHGQEIADPYRWLEDLNSKETKDWIKKQNQFSQSYLNNVNQKQSIKDILIKAYDKETKSVPFRVQSKTFFYFNDGKWQQSKLFFRENNQEKQQLVLDPNTFSDDGTIALGGVDISPNSELMAYAIADGGSDWRTWKIRDIKTGEDLKDTIAWSKFSNAEWAKDNSGFYYSAYAKPKEGDEYESLNTNQRLFFHKLGQNQTEDQLIFERPDHPEWGFGATVSEDGKYLVLSVSEGTDERNRIFYKDLSNENNDFIELIGELKAQFNFVGNEGSVFWFFTDLNAPMGRVIAIDVNQSEEEDWQELIPEKEYALTNVRELKDFLVCQYLVDVTSRINLYQKKGHLEKTMQFSKTGTISSLSSQPQTNTFYFSFSNYIQPNEIYEYDASLDTLNTIWKKRVPGYNADNYISNKVFYESKDGTMIPMFISHQKGVSLNNGNPLLLYGYGGFDISILPGFRERYFAWMKMGGVVAIPNLRGGGEYGEKWHQQGMLHNKQNVFDDFAAATEYLHREGYSRPGLTTIEGRSNGGLLVGATLLQRPGLFGATLPGVGVMDMLRFNKFTIGWAWESDYGSPEKEDDFNVLIKYSPYHNIKDDQCYPPTLITTSEFDDRVVPSHSYKFAARMQRAQNCEHPILIRIETRAGHGAGTPKDKIIDNIADVYGFALNALLEK